MPFPEEIFYTSEDYWNLPGDQRAELIDGRLYSMAPPSRIHQKLSTRIASAFDRFISEKNGSCEVYSAPFAVNLNADDKTYVEPDISVICDRGKLTDRGCEGAPDLVIEIVSPSSRRIDYTKKNTLYAEAGVREYWIVDPEKERTVVYRYEDDAAPVFYLFTDRIPAGIFPELSVTVADLLK